MSKNTKIILKNLISQNLAFRHSADALFDYIDSLKNINIIIDFYNIQTTSQAFMHQFLYRLEKSNNNIKCINIPENVKKMINIIKRRNKK